MRADLSISLLVIRARAGDQHAWNALVARYAPGVVSGGRRELGGARGGEHHPITRCELPTPKDIAMNRIRRIRRLLACTGPPGTAEPRASQPTGPAAPRANRFGRGGFAGRFIQDVAAAATMAAGQNWPAPATADPRRHMVITPGLLPRTVQLCIHCRHNPAGFWVSRTGGQTVRRPWCLPCCQELEPDLCEVIPFDS